MKTAFRRVSKRLSSSRPNNGTQAAFHHRERSLSVTSAPPEAKVVKEEVLRTPFRWIQLKKLVYQDESGVEREWESAERTTRKSDVDAVFVAATLRHPGPEQEEELLLVSQYRPPMKAYCIEFPAGLVDKGEDAATAALRELREETGYIGEVVKVSPIVASDAGFSNCNLQFVMVDIDMSLEENRNPSPQQEEDETITSHIVPKSKLLEYLDDTSRLRREENVVVCGRLYAAAIGI